MAERVRALLAKAESTEFPEEAEALTAKAQELIARHSIDRALLEDDAGTEVVGRRVLLDDPYADAKAMLLAEVAVANRCRAVQTEGLGFSTVFGLASHLDAVDLLYASLLTQATAAMVAAGKGAGGASRRQPSYRRAFLVAYAVRIGERLAAATGEAVDAARVEHGDRLLPVLAAQDAAVDAAVDEAFSDLVSKQLRRLNAAGFVAGREAADRARLGPDGELRAG
jgi:hypothetical protein